MQGSALRLVRAKWKGLIHFEAELIVTWGSEEANSSHLNESSMAQLHTLQQSSGRRRVQERTWASLQCLTLGFGMRK